MKKLLYISLLFSVCLLSSCFEEYEERYLLTENRIEFDDAVVNANASGKDYPLVDALSSTAGIVKYRVNMTGEQKDYDRTVNFQVVTDETTAREGVDYKFPSGTSFVIPAGSSFGYVEVEILPDGGGSPRLVIELLSTEDIKAMVRYDRIGIPILYPFVAPNPDNIEELNDIRIFNNITFGSSGNTSVGNYIDLHTGYAYIPSGADDNQEKIDMIILRSGAGTEQNILTPSSGSVTAWGNSSRIPDLWTVRNTGTLMLLHDPSSIELDMYETAQTKAELDAAFDYFEENIEDRPNYSTYNGPSTRIREVTTGDLLVFRSDDRDVVAIMKIEESVPGSTGLIRGQLKSGGEGEL